MNVFFIILSILWFIGGFGFGFNIYQLLKEYSQNEFNKFKVIILEIRCHYNLVTMWVSMVGIIILTSLNK